MGKEKNNLSRRSFLTGTAAAASVAAFTGLVGCAPRSAADQPDVKNERSSTGGVDPSSINWDNEADVVIIGSGSAGTCAAIEAAEAGSSVIIFEKNQAMYGGNSALCGGYMLAADWSTQEELTGYVGDTGEAFAEQMLRWSQGLGNQEMIREACLRSGEAVDWMMSTGREYTGASILPPIWSCGDTEEDVVPRSIHNHDAYGATEGHMATLRARVDALDNVKISMGSEVVHIIQNPEGEVIGVQLADGSYAKALKGVVLACASVDNNTQMAKDLGLMQQLWGMTMDEAGAASLSNPDMDTNEGDGIRMLREIGADLCMSQACCMNDDQYVGGISDWGVTAYMGQEPNIYESYTTRGAILVNRYGRRFCQDDAEWGYVIHEASKEAYQTGWNPEDPLGVCLWYVCDADHYWAFQGKGITVEESEYTYSANSIEELAEIMGCDAAVLNDEINRWNSYCETGVDLDFGRKADFGKIITPPFYADIMRPGPMGTFAGAKSNVKAEVLDLRGEPIPRLYAAGTVAGGNITGPFYFGCGWAITNTVVWGREAGQNVAALEPWS